MLMGMVSSWWSLDLGEIGGLPDSDSDGDGVTDYEEFLTGGNPKR